MCITNQLAYHRESSYSFFSKTSLFVFPVLINQLGKKKHRIFGCRLFGLLQLNDSKLRRRFLRRWRHFTVIHQLLRPLRSLAEGWEIFVDLFMVKLRADPPVRPHNFLGISKEYQFPAPLNFTFNWEDQQRD